MKITKIILAAAISSLSLSIAIAAANTTNKILAQKSQDELMPSIEAHNSLYEEDIEAMVQNIKRVAATDTSMKIDISDIAQRYIVIGADQAQLFGALRSQSFVVSPSKAPPERFKMHQEIYIARLEFSGLGMPPEAMSKREIRIICGFDNKRLSQTSVLLFNHTL